MGDMDGKWTFDIMDKITRDTLDPKEDLKVGDEVSVYWESGKK